MVTMFPRALAVAVMSRPGDLRDLGVQATRPVRHPQLPLSYAGEQDLWRGSGGRRSTAAMVRIPDPDLA
jgi:hypothetical protein